MSPTEIIEGDIVVTESERVRRGTLPDLTLSEALEKYEFYTTVLANRLRVADDPSLLPNDLDEAGRWAALSPEITARWVDLVSRQASVVAQIRFQTRTSIGYKANKT